MPSSAHPQTRKKPSLPREAWLIAGLAVLARLFVLVSTGFTNEDFMITLRYVENLAAGNGLVYNVGERVLGTTTPLYALLLGLTAKLGLSPVWLGKGLNVLADGALCVVVYAWVRSLGWDRAALVAAFFVAVNPLHLRWSVSGMETSLVTLAGMGAWVLYTHRRYLACYGVLGVLFLLRWDSLMLTGVLTLGVIWRERRLPWRELLLTAGIAAPWVAYATWFYGSPIPVTAASKMAVYSWQESGLMPQAHKLAALLFGNPLYFLSTLLASAGVWTVIRRLPDRTLEPTLLPPMAWFAVYWLAWLVSKVLLFEWYVVPPLPVWEMLVALGAVGVWERVTRAPNAERPTPNASHPHFHASTPRRILAVALLATAAAFGIWRTHYLCRENQKVEQVVRKPLALWLRENSRPEDTVMLEPIGYIGYYSQRRVLDVIGLVSPQVVPFWKDSSPAPLLDIARAYQPEWAVLRPKELARIRQAAQASGPAWEADYELLRTWDYVPPDPGRERVTFHVFRRL